MSNDSMASIALQCPQPNGGQSPDDRPALSYRDVQVTYPGGAQAVRGVTLDVMRGECLALVGESGCGKTTLARAALGLLPEGTQVDGSIRVDGTEVVTTPARQLRRMRGRRVGFIGQDPYAGTNPLHRVARHVAEAWRAHSLREPSGAVTERLAALGIDDAGRRGRSYPHEWSGGMLQRATIAAAAVHDPPLVIADEPTTALDADLANSVLDALRHAGCAVLLVTHDLTVVDAHADRIAVCYAGRVVQSGPASAVLDGAEHPYTAALLAAAPRDGHGLPQRMPGAPPGPEESVPGCAFADRCPEVFDPCASQRPLLRKGVACWRRERGQ